MNAYRGITASLALCLSIATAHAEMRVWSDKSGHSVEAQFIQMSGSKVILETVEGKRIMVPQTGLCDADLTYLASAIPPTLKIDVDVDIDRDKKANGYYHEKTQENITCNASIEKTNKDKCTRKFKAYLYILAKQMHGGGRKIIGLQELPLSFETKDSITFDASATVKSAEGYSWSEGFKYEGYLVVVEDEEGTVIATRTNKNTYETHLQNLKKGRNGAEFTDDFVKR